MTTACPIDAVACAPSVCGVALAADPLRYGELRVSDAEVGDAELRSRLEDDGYLFLPGALDRGEVLAARADLLRRLADAGELDPGYAIEAGISRAGASGFRPDLAMRSPELARVLYAGAMMALFTRLFAGPVRHYDFTWLRTVPPGNGSPSHCDRVYMGRGTRRVCTAWTPLGDLTADMGGLVVLEGSHRRASRLRRYLARDVDEYCTNRANAGLAAGGRTRGRFDGTLSSDAHGLRDKLSGRWLTNAFRAGDVVIFGMELVHAGTDNRTPRLRLSADSRYQRADEPIDERWIGPQPIGHGAAGKRGRVC